MVDERHRCDTYKPIGYVIDVVHPIFEVMKTSFSPQGISKTDFKELAPPLISGSKSQGFLAKGNYALVATREIWQGNPFCASLGNLLFRNFGISHHSKSRKSHRCRTFSAPKVMATSITRAIALRYYMSPVPGSSIPSLTVLKGNTPTISPHRAQR